MFLNPDWGPGRAGAGGLCVSLTSDAFRDTDGYTVLGDTFTAHGGEVVKRLDGNALTMAFFDGPAFAPNSMLAYSIQLLGA